MLGCWLGKVGLNCVRLSGLFIAPFPRGCCTLGFVVTAGGTCREEGACCSWVVGVLIGMRLSMPASSALDKIVVGSPTNDSLALPVRILESKAAS